jgi:chemotaxis family two-component system sensor kinase Cph1
MATVDLKRCDLEPIHIPGSIQPFVSLVAFKEGSSQIGWWSEDFSSHPLMARATSGLSAMSPTALFGHALAGARHDAPATIQDGDGCKWRVTPHVHGGNTIVEIEPWAEESIEVVRALQLGITQMVSAMQDAVSVQDLCDAGASSLQRITGYDRVMVYRFHPDAHGEVIAEARNPALSSFLGLHYPASDIPPQARAIFLANWLRMIPDAHYTPVRLLAASADLGPLDLGRAPGRSVSPIHVEYLRNMEVRASLTVSIIHRGQLWGLIACHHCAGPKTPGPEVRSACELAGKLISSLLGIKRDQETADMRAHAKQKLGELVQRMMTEPDLTAALLEGSPSVLDLMPSIGAAAAVYHDNQWKLIGRTPSLEQVRALAVWLHTEGQHDVFHTDHLAASYPPAENFFEIASGLLSVSIPKGDGNFVMWFRPEILQTVKWGGNPEKPAFADEAGAIHPRNSFVEWKQSVRMKAAPWQEWEVECATELRSAILAADLRAQFQKEQTARLEAEAANQAKQDLMAVVSHDLKNPLNAIIISMVLIRRSLEAKQTAAADRMLAGIERATTRMKRLIEDLLDVAQIESGNIELTQETANCSELLHETADILAPLVEEKSIALRVLEPLDALRARCDRERVLQVLSNLAGNAIKFTADGGSVTLGAHHHAGEVVFRVTDTGPGIAPENLSRVFDRFWQAKETRLQGTGLGLAISKGIVSAHGGRIWVESEVGKGATFMFSLPLGLE